MSDFIDDALSRYLGQQPGMREALLGDPVQHAQTELMRNLLDAAERAMSTEGVPEDVRRRVVNRMVWGDPEGRADVYTETRRQAIAALDASVFSPEEMMALLADGEEWARDEGAG